MQSAGHSRRRLHCKGQAQTRCTSQLRGRTACMPPAPHLPPTRGPPWCDARATLAVGAPLCLPLTCAPPQGLCMGAACTHASLCLCMGPTAKPPQPTWCALIAATSGLLRYGRTCTHCTWRQPCKQARPCTCQAVSTACTATAQPSSRWCKRKGMLRAPPEAHVAFSSCL